jgi:hypothetical protein
MIFTPGQIVSTRGIHERMSSNPKFAEFVTNSLTRHFSGDWGTVDPSDTEANNYALVNGERLLSAYILENQRIKIWIISEGDRSVTTVLFPHEY